VKTLSTEELEVLKLAVHSCAPGPGKRRMADPNLGAIIWRLIERGILALCQCDADDTVPHAAITPLGRTALECAKALEAVP
jgi:hypothetical protein